MTELNSPPNKQSNRLTRSKTGWGNKRVYSWHLSISIKTQLSFFNIEKPGSKCTSLIHHTCIVWCFYQSQMENFYCSHSKGSNDAFGSWTFKRGTNRIVHSLVWANFFPLYIAHHKCSTFFPFPKILFNGLYYTINEGTGWWANLFSWPFFAPVTYLLFRIVS